jgi:hypothetical protein
MQHAKRMVLVDEKFLENFWRKDDSSWKRPTEQKAKSLLNHELKSDLDNPSIPDDVKAKQHQQHLNRFLHTSRQLPASEPTQDLIDLKTVDDLLDLEIPKKKVKKAKKEVTTARRSKRKPKINFKWES